MERDGFHHSRLCMDRGADRVRSESEYPEDSENSSASAEYLFDIRSESSSFSAFQVFS